jgi:hypothetical protein
MVVVNTRVGLVPLRSSEESLLELLPSPLAKGSDCASWKRDRSATPLGLRLDQLYGPG